MKRGTALLVVLAVPLLLGAKDPRGDVVDCATGQPASGPDLVAVRGTAEELQTVARWRLTFARRVEVPSDLRIDVLVRDPRLPPASLGSERGMNRIVRWEATSSNRPIEIMWLPHDGSTSFNPPVVSGRTVQFVAPGRLLLGESVNGGEGVMRARWSVVVRAGSACDRLGNGIPTRRLAATASSPPTPPASTTAGANESRTATSSPQRPAPPLAVWVLLPLILAALTFLAVRRRVGNGGSSSRRGSTKLPSGHG